jgi:hypothetical protein
MVTKKSLVPFGCGQLQRRFRGLREIKGLVDENTTI